MFLVRRGAAPALLLTAALLAGCASADAPGTDEAPAPTPGAPAVTAEPAPSAEPEAPAALTDEDIARITDAVARDPQALLPYLATEVHVLIAATEAAGMLAPAEAVVVLSGTDGLIDTIFMAAGPELLDG